MADRVETKRRSVQFTMSREQFVQMVWDALDDTVSTESVIQHVEVLSTGGITFTLTETEIVRPTRAATS